MTYLQGSCRGNEHFHQQLLLIPTLRCRDGLPLKTEETGNLSIPDCILDIIGSSAKFEIIRKFLNQVD